MFKSMTKKQARLAREKAARRQRQEAQRVEEWMNRRACELALERRRPSDWEAQIKADLERKASAERAKATAGWSDTASTGESWRDIGR